MNKKKMLGMIVLAGIVSTGLAPTVGMSYHASTTNNTVLLAQRNVTSSTNDGANNTTGNINGNQSENNSAPGNINNNSKAQTGLSSANNKVNNKTNESAANNSANNMTNKTVNSNTNNDVNSKANSNTNNNENANSNATNSGNNNINNNSNKNTASNTNNSANSNQTMTKEQAAQLKGKTITVGNMKFGGLKAVKIAPNQQGTGFMATPGFDPNGFASNVNEQLYNYELNPANDNAAMNEAIQLHGGNPVDTCVFFQSSALRAIGQDVPDSIGYTTHLENWLSNNGWTRHTDFQYIQRGDICFASYYHTFLFMGWENKSQGIAYVMGNESFTEPYYRNRNLNGQSPVTYGDNSYYQATCFWTYGQGYTGPVEGTNPVHPGGYNSIGTATTNTTINLRSGAGTSNSILGQVPNGVTVPVIAQSGSWFEVYYGGEIGWIDGNYTNGLDESLGNGSANTNMPVGDNLTVTSPVGLWLNSAPSTNSNQIVLLPNNTPLKAIGYGNGWYKVNYEGTIGYIDANYTSANGSDILPAGDTLNNGPSSSTNNGSGNQNSGKTFSQQIVDGTVTVTANGLWINQNPFPNDGNLVVAPQGTKLHAVAESSNGWYKVTYNGQTGWIGGAPYSTFTKTPKHRTQTSYTQQSVNGTVTVLAGGLCLNQNPFPNDGVIAVLPQGTKVQATAKSSNGWYKVTYNGQTGWIGGMPYSSFKAANQAAPAPSSSNNSNNSTTQTATVTSPIGLWLLGSPNMGGSKIEVMPANASLQVIGQNGNWTEVQYNGQTGWCYTQYINITSQSSNSSSAQPAQSQNTPSSNSGTTGQNQNTPSSNSGTASTATVASPIGLWLLGSPNMGGSKIEVMPDNASLQVIGQSGNWTEVQYNGQTGWCYTDYITMGNNNSGQSTTSNTQTGTVNANGGLWLNTNPSLTNSGNIEIMPQGATITIYKQQGSWSYVSYNGQSGWAYSEYIN
ncbi:MAG: SH3 domain-containing protein [Sarcina sp.]